MTIFAMRSPSDPAVAGWRPLVLGIALSIAVPCAAWAQIGAGMPGNGIAGSRGSPMQTNKPEKPVLAAPDAVPGAKARLPVAPPTHVAGDLQPTDALFDAINRGDIAAARDALNRGADLNDVNVLGMTPMELSVDLGRNDISFLLLSMRGEDAGRGSRAMGRDGGQDVARAAPPVKPSAPARHATAAKSAAHGKGGDTLVATKPLATPKLFANDGGTPLPSAGFLGFDSRSATN